MIKTKPAEIIDHWSKILDESDLSVDWDEAHERCWACGEKRKLEKCHVIPDSLGGADAPENLVLLCYSCHTKAPNTKDSKFFIQWLKSQKVSMYGASTILEALKLYTNLTGKCFLTELSSKEIVFKQVQEYLDRRDCESQAIHFGQGNQYNASTKVGIFIDFLNEWNSREDEKNFKHLQEKKSKLQ